jgi:hypothetical protein
MRSGNLRGIINRARALFVLVLICAPLVCLPQQPGSFAQTQSVDPEAFRIKAEMHHDLALHFLKKGDAGKALFEARQIIQSRIPPEYENAVFKSISIIAEELGSLPRYDLAQVLLDETLKVVTEIPIRVNILKNKARLYYLAGETDKAIGAMKRAEAEARRRND